MARGFLDFYREALRGILGFPKRQEEVSRGPRPLIFPDVARRRHFVVFGQTGAGKSSFIEALVLFDILRRVTGRSRRGIAVTDVHGDLVRNIRVWAALIAHEFPVLRHCKQISNAAILGEWNKKQQKNKSELYGRNMKP
jgi:recombinational DNA repair ATPase RecF